ncbi:MAG: radical SAM protein [Candidatus Bathyarchaeia archaeon]
MTSHSTASVDSKASEALPESRTASLCPVCLTLVPARIFEAGGRAYMVKNCPEHGSFTGLVWSSAERYVNSFKYRRPGSKFAECATSTDRGCPYDCGLCPDHLQHTCLAIVEVTQKCNLHCAVCLASAPKAEQPSLEEFEFALKALLRHEGAPTPLQLSGGEPTTRRDLCDIVELTRSLGFKYVEIDSNGIELARNPKLTCDLAKAGLDGVYLQFDGVTDDVYAALRGANLLNVKLQAVRNALKAGLRVTLACTLVKNVNDHQAWDIVKYAVRQGLTGVNFQPLAFLGRYPSEASFVNPLERITNSDVAFALASQSGGEVSVSDFIPVPCPDNRCQLMAYMKVEDGKLVPASRSISQEELTEYYAMFTDSSRMDEAVKAVAERMKRSNEASELPQLPTAGCCSGSTSCLPTQAGPSSGGERYFAVTSHAMMDVWNTDVNRLRRCCVHELTLDGKLTPFCLYNYTSLTGETLYRGVRRDQHSR